MERAACLVVAVSDGALLTLMEKLVIPQLANDSPTRRRVFSAHVGPERQGEGSMPGSGGPRLLLHHQVEGQQA